MTMQSTITTDELTYQLLDAHSKSEARVRDLPDVESFPGDTGWKLFDEIMGEADELRWDLARHQPTTLQGVIATLKEVGNTGCDGERWPSDPNWFATLHKSLASALERIAGG